MVEFVYIHYATNEPLFSTGEQAVVPPLPPLGATITFNTEAGAIVGVVQGIHVVVETAPTLVHRYVIAIEG